MVKNVIAVFDVGKTNKKFLLFDEVLNPVHLEERIFPEIADEDGFACDDVSGIEQWMDKCLSDVILAGHYDVRAVNFTTYGATLMFIDKQGERLTPLYNYLKPMPEDVQEGLYEKYGGREDFSCVTASPALGMLNSGLQVFWLKKTRPELFTRVRSILHLPQYLSYYFTRQVTSEYTSLGCHTAMWDFNGFHYHGWLTDEGICLPYPISNSTMFRVDISHKPVSVGIGIHDSSASLVPYLRGSDSDFILLSTGTWCIFMNPFNNEPLTPGQLRDDALCYMSIRQQQVKSSRFFLGHIHAVNVERISRHFNVNRDSYKDVKADRSRLSRLFREKKERTFFRSGVPEGYLDIEADLSAFKSFDEAYYRFMFDLVDVSMGSLNLIIPENDTTRNVYISGGFARNELFCMIMAMRLPDKDVYVSEIDNASALGAAMVIYESVYDRKLPGIDLGLKRVK